MKRLAPCLAAFCVSGTVLAVDSATLSINELAGPTWRLSDLRASISGLAGTHQHLSLQIGSMRLPPPFDRLDRLHVDCPGAAVRGAEIRCPKGRAEVHGEGLDRPAFGVAFALSPDGGNLTLEDLAVFGGRSRIEAAFGPDGWHLGYFSKNLGLARLARALKNHGAMRFSGDVDASGEVAGEGANWETATLRFSIARGAVDNDAGTLAGEDLAGQGSVRIEPVGGGAIAARARLALAHGALYAEPVFIEPRGAPIDVSANLVWDGAGKTLGVADLTYAHPGHGTLRAAASLDMARAPSVRRLELALESDRLAAFYATYAAPFVAATALEGVVPDGAVSARAVLAGDRLTRVEAHLSGLSVTDPRGRFELAGGAGHVAWAREAAEPSTLAWTSAKVFAIPIGAARLGFQAGAGTLRLTEPASLAVLGGRIDVETFEWRTVAGGEPAVRFDGKIVDLSLEQLSDALGWTPLSGRISGAIPGVSVLGDRLVLDGTLRAKVFDGDVRIQSLAVENLFGELPALSADLAFTRLDLKALTSRFAFGAIEGRLDGHVKGLYLENWRPVAFDAWFGTPADDPSPHRISQKAVESISSIGGGGTANALSRTFLRLFDAFGYARLGLGCRLRAGVCELTGVGPVDSGYYIVEGGGLPRIDVIGYNRRVDWEVLLERLKRITASGAAVVQ